MRIGIFGGGQLAKMLALAGHPMGIDFTIVDPSPNACAFPLGKPLRGAYDDPATLEELATTCDAVTYEFENISLAACESLARRVAFAPAAEALGVKQDRLAEKKIWKEIGVPAAEYVAIDSPEDLKEAKRKLALPFVVKTRSMGYDGKGQWVVRDEQSMTACAAELGGVPAIAEQFIAFDREFSILAARHREGTTVYYPLTENVHRGGILHTSVCRPNDSAATAGREYIGRLLDKFGYVGVLCIEFFERGGEILANEYAPRVHNSGHWTIEGAVTSQFANHVRAVLGLPLGETTCVGPTAMVNCIGRMPATEALLKIPGVSVHAYGKRPREGRKVGHATIRAADEPTLRKRMEQVVGVIDGRQ